MTVVKRECTKIKYPSKIAALVGVARCKSAYPQRAYRCPHCGSWHITTQPYRPRFVDADEDA